MKLTQLEQRAAITIAGIYGLRMLGLFLVLPVLVVYAQGLPDYSVILAGLAVGIYGLGQALLQIPLGYLSDRFGRKPIIIAGLLIFALGSYIAAESTTLTMLVIGRAIQGAGAIASTLMAFVSDLSRPEVRSKLMAAIGATIGFAFVLSLILGPWLTVHIGVSGLFYFTAVLSIAAIAVVVWLVPEEQKIHIDNSHVLPVTAQMKSVFANQQLQLMNASIFALHLLLTAMFVVIPLKLLSNGLPLEDHSITYLTVMMASFLLMLPMMIWTEKKQQHVTAISLALFMLVVATLLLSVQPSLMVIFVCLGLFFFAFNFLEAMIPSIVSRLCAAKQRGTAMGFYSTSQFSGAFMGGLLAGYCLQALDEQILFWILCLICLIWFIAIRIWLQPVAEKTDT